jgi:hypothetical protein
VWTLAPEQTVSLLRQPESGMGYQIVQPKEYLKDSRIYVTINAVLLVTLEELLQKLPPTEAALDTLLASSESVFDPRVEFRVVEEADAIMRIYHFLGPSGPSGPQVLVPSVPFGPGVPLPRIAMRTRQGEIFKRFSAYRNDRRVTDEGLNAGTYATTHYDATVVPSALAAVARYALPNHLPARHVFTITPQRNIHIQCGTVQPAFGQSGGGVEVLFKTMVEARFVNRPPYKIPER